VHPVLLAIHALIREDLMNRVTHQPFASFVALALLIVAPFVVPASSRAASRPIREPDALVILSTTDVRGRTDPCGCHVPKGGLARRVSFADSIRATYGQVVLVDDGGFFPDGTVPKATSWFLMDAMTLMGTDAVGTSERELSLGLGYLRSQLRRTRLPMVCANLHERATGKLVLPAYVLKTVGTVKVGIFGLMSPTPDLGPSRDSLQVEEPQAAAVRTVAELRRKGATVVVLLSQLGRMESEDLVATVDGVDAVIIGHGVPLLQKGRTIKHTVACYGGEQGHYIGRTLLRLDAQRRVTSGENEAFMLGPEVPDHKEMARLVRHFTEVTNAAEAKIAPATAAPDSQPHSE